MCSIYRSTNEDSGEVFASQASLALPILKCG